MLCNLSLTDKKTHPKTPQTIAKHVVKPWEYSTVTPLQICSVFWLSFSFLLPSILDDWQHAYYCWLVSIHCKVGITYDESTVPVIDEWQRFYYSWLVSTDCKVGITCSKNNVPIIHEWQHFCYCEWAPVDCKAGSNLQYKYCSNKGRSLVRWW